MRLSLVRTPDVVILQLIRDRNIYAFNRSHIDEGKWSVWSAPSPKVEAEALLKLVRFNGSTVETIREPIAIPAETEEYFRSYVAHHPEEKSPIERVMEFRRRVREEGDRLVKLIQKNGQPLKEGGELELEFFEQRPND